MPGLPWWNSLEAVVPVADIGGQVSQLVGDEMDDPALALDVDRAGRGDDAALPL
jgi:hypothetical protein